MKDAIKQSCAENGSVKTVSKISAVDLDIFFINHWFKVDRYEEKYRSASGYGAWLIIDAELYLVAAAAINETVWVKTFPQSVPLMAASTVSGLSDHARMRAGQEGWFADFFGTIKSMTHSFADYDRD